MFKRSKQPSGFPKLVFFLLRLVQLICAVIVLGILAFFFYHLWKDGFSTPYEFSLLDFASAATLLNLFVTSILLCCCGLSPLYVIILDSLLLLLWVIAFSLLVKAMGGTTTQTCTTDNWGNAEGIRVCHLFKTLVAMSFIVIVSFVATIGVAVFARRKQAMHKYEPTHNPANIRAGSTAYGAGAAVPSYGTGVAAPAHSSPRVTSPVPPAYTPAAQHAGQPAVQQQYSPRHGAAYYG